MPRFKQDSETALLSQSFQRRSPHKIPAASISCHLLSQEVSNCSFRIPEIASTINSTHFFIFFVDSLRRQSYFIRRCLFRISMEIPSFARMASLRTLRCLRNGVPKLIVLKKVQSRLGHVLLMLTALCDTSLVKFLPPIHSQL